MFSENRITRIVRLQTYSLIDRKQVIPGDHIDVVLKLTWITNDAIAPVKPLNDRGRNNIVQYRRNVIDTHPRRHPINNRPAQAIKVRLESP